MVRETEILQRAATAANGDEDMFCAFRQSTYGPPERRGGGGGRDRNARDEAADREAERQEGLACYSAHAITGYLFGTDREQRNADLEQLQKMFNAEYDRGGRAAMRTLFNSLRTYTADGGGGGMIEVTGMRETFDRRGNHTGWNVTVRERGRRNAPLQEVNVPKNRND